MTGIVCGLSLLAGGFWGWPVTLLLIALLLATSLAGARYEKLLTICLALAALGAIRVAPRNDIVTPVWIGDEQTLVGTVAGAPTDDGSRQRFVVRARPAEANSGALPEARICVTAPPLPRVWRGDRLLLSGELQSLAVASERIAGSLRYRGCAGALAVDSFAIESRGGGIQRAFDSVRRRMTDALQLAAPGDAGALLSGLATGDDTAMTFSRRNAFIVTGTSHVTAVSGSNLSLLIAMAVVGTSLLGSVRSPWRLAIFAGVIWSYVAMVGWSPPAARAAVVAVLALLARAIGRRPDFVTLAVVAAAIEAVVRPVDIDSLAFQLSTVSAISLVLGLGGRSPAGWSGWLKHGVAATAVTQAATAALLVPAFNRLSIYAIPVNLIIGPLCSAAFPLALTAGAIGMASPTLGAAFAFPSRVLAELVLAAVTVFAQLPLADAGRHLPEWIPAAVWLPIGAGVVIAVSRECRGGIARRCRTVREWDARQTAVAIGAAGGACAGVMIFAISR